MKLVDRLLLLLLAIVWLILAVPIAIISIQVRRIPLWPDFEPDSSAADVLIWLVFVGVLYLTPIWLSAVSWSKTRKR